MKHEPHAHSILYVDDDQDDLQLLRKAMDRLGADYRLLEAVDGVEALELLHLLSAVGELPCLIVLDINMPRMDGRRTFQQIRSNPKLAQIPVVVFSTSNSPLDRLFFRGGQVEYITKPVSFELLLGVAQRMLHHCRHHGVHS